MLVFDDVNATFLHNPKAAGTSIKTWLYDVTGKTPNDIINREPHDVVENLCVGFTFCCVRNTYEKLVSTYEYLNVSSGVMSNLTFEKFVDSLTEDRMKPFSYPQMMYVKNSDYIMRFENLENDFKAIQNLFGCDKHLPIKNVTQYDKYNWKRYYTNEIRKKVESLYKEDIDVLGYEF